MGNRVIVVKSERQVKRGGKMVYLDTIERSPNEVINVFDPYDIKHKTKHVKLQNNIAQKEQMQKLNRDEKVLVFCLSYYLDWETNIIVGDGEIGEKNKPLRAGDIDKICGLDRHRRAKAVRGLISKNVLAYILTEDRRKAYVMNPDWALNGRNPQEALVKTFYSKHDVEELQKVVENEPIPVQEVVQN